MKITLRRIAKREEYTIGRLSIDGKYVCDTLEDRVRDLSKEAKIPGRTAIPEGSYNVVVTESSKFKRLLPRLLNVPQFEGILIHSGNTHKDTAGCILVGENTTVGRVSRSSYWESIVTRRIHEARKRGEAVEIEIL